MILLLLLIRILIVIHCVHVLLLRQILLLILLFDHLLHINFMLSSHLILLCLLYKVLYELLKLFNSLFRQISRLIRIHNFFNSRICLSEMFNQLVDFRIWFLFDNRLEVLYRRRIQAWQTRFRNLHLLMIRVEWVLNVDKEGEYHLVLEWWISAELTQTELVVILSDWHQINVYVLNFLVTNLLRFIKSKYRTFIVLLLGGKMFGKSLKASLVLLVEDNPAFKDLLAVILQFSEIFECYSLTCCTFQL